MRRHFRHDDVAQDDDDDERDPADVEISPYSGIYDGRDRGGR